ncbi:MAG TPA: hypothetical protein VGB20_06785 [bacterium]
MSQTQSLDDIDDLLVGELHKRMPIEHRPFHTLGQKAGISEQECLARVERLAAREIVGGIRAAFDAAALGYECALIAMQPRPANVESAAAHVGRHPGVFQCVRVLDPFALWCALAVPPGDSLEQVVRLLHAQAGSEETLILPALEVYKAVSIHSGATPAVLLDELEELGQDERRMSAPPPLAASDLRLIRILQQDLPLMEMPYTVWAEQGELTEDELFAWMGRMEHLGYVRRFAAEILRPRGAAPATALLAWRVAEEQCAAVGQAMSKFREVSSCCRRPSYDSWPYPLISVVHAATRDACREALRRLHAHVGPLTCKSLFVETVFKQTRISLFSPELEQWWKDVAGAEDNLNQIGKQ